MHAKLMVISGPLAGQTIVIHGGKFIIGREQDCHLRPDSEFISRHHCVILLDEYTLRARDLGSKNGTFVNGERLAHEIVLKNDDMISVGEITFQVDLVSDDTVLDATGSRPNAALQGTDVFDGNTLPAEATEQGVSAVVPSVPVHVPGAEPPPGVLEDTKHLSPPEAADR